MKCELRAYGWAPQPHVHPQLTQEYIKRLCSAAHQRSLGDLSGFRALLSIVRLPASLGRLLLWQRLVERVARSR